MPETLEVNHTPPHPEVFAHDAGMLALAEELNPRLDRAAEISTAIDPEHTLPDVQLVPKPTNAQRVARGTMTDMNYVIMHSGIEVGGTTIVTDKIEKERYFTRIVVNQGLRDQGFGTSTYKEVITDGILNGYGFRTASTTQSASAKKIWEDLETKGVARMIEPFTRAENDKFAGHYVIDADTSR